MIVISLGFVLHHKKHHFDYSERDVMKEDDTITIDTTNSSARNISRCSSLTMTKFAQGSTDTKYYAYFNSNTFYSYGQTLINLLSLSIVANM